MKRLRGSIENGFWIDKYDKPRKLVNMSDDYINACIKFLEDRISVQVHATQAQIDIEILKYELLDRQARSKTYVRRLLYG